jgi:heme/copper-type cytochrome/quinol oxidase subunit 1
LRAIAGNWMHMTTIETHPDPALVTRDAPAVTGGALADLASWITTTDHKRIGRMFVGLSLVSALGIAVIGALLGFERMDADSLLDVNSLTQLFSLFRVGLAFLVVVPLLLGLAVTVVPLQLGAKAITFARTAALGFWTWVAGAAVVITSYAMDGGPGGGDPTGVDLFLLGLGLAVIGLIVVAASVAATVLTSRAPGMRLDRVPMFAWSALVGAVGLLLTLPVLVGVLIYLFVDHRFGVRAELNANGWGGNVGINSWIQFALSQPQTFVYAIPVLGLAAEFIPVFARRRMAMRGAVLAGMGIFATAALSGVSQGMHMIADCDGGTCWSQLGDFDKVQSVLPWAFFNLLPLLGLVVVIGATGLTLLPALRNKTLRFGAPLFYGLGGAALLGAAVVANVFTQISDLHLITTVYEEGAFTLVAYGAVVAGLGGLVYWGPKIWGRTMPAAPTFLLLLLALGATVLVSGTYLLSGFNNQPGTFSADPAEFVDHDAAPELLNALNGIGHALMGVAVLGFVLLALYSFTRGPRAGDDPWDGQTLEWATSSPPPADNFAGVPTVASPEPLTDLKPSGTTSDAAALTGRTA